jgi:hypothetical protein
MTLWELRDITLAWIPQIPKRQVLGKLPYRFSKLLFINRFFKESKFETDFSNSKHDPSK